VVVVSHDRHLLELIADRLVLVDNGTAKEFDGSLDDYRDKVLGTGESRAEQDAKSAAQADRKAARQRAMEANERAKAARRIAREAEAELKRLWARRDDIDAELSAPQKNGGTPIGELMKLRAEVEREVAAAEQRWLEASEAADHVKTG
jgi:ATP-binding cassette subfamily F protein 3